MACKCIDKVNELLIEQHETRLDIPLMFNLTNHKATQDKVLVATKKVDGSKKPAKKVFASYCPFCGKKYEAKSKKKAALA
jgi:hypothetical protein